MADFRHVDELLRLEHTRIWRDWYRDVPDYRPPTIDFAVRDATDWYNHNENLITLSICEGNLDDSDVLNAAGWPVWRIALVHEMMHEFEHKRIVVPTEAGRSLAARFRGRFDPPKVHGAPFFSAIADRAAYFGMSPEALAGRL